MTSLFERTALRVPLIISLLFVSSIFAEKAPGEVVNQIRYTIGEVPITEMDIDAMQRHLRNMRQNSSRHAAIELLIEKTIVEIEASRSSIIVSDQKMKNEVVKRMEAGGIPDEETFKKAVEREARVPYDDWLEDLRYQILKRQLIQISIDVGQPSEAELKRFYYSKRDKIGDEIMYREIALRPANLSAQEEMRISKLANAIRAKVSANPASFANIARTHPDNASSYRASGGLVPYTPIFEIARIDRMLAGILYQMRPGQVSQVFRDQANRYVIVQLVARRPVAFDKVEGLIRQMIYMEREGDSFKKWIEKQKKATVIREIK